MAFVRPTLAQIRERIETDFKSGLGLRFIVSRSFLKVFASAFAGASHTLHGHIQDFAQKQLFPDSADEEFLIRWSNLFGVTRLPANFAILTVRFTGSVGGAVPINTVMQSPDGVEYRVERGGIVRLAPGAIHPQFETTAVAGVAGSSGNLIGGTELSLISPITGVNPTVTVQSVFVEGEDEEGLESLRTRLVERIQNPPSGGTVSDYIAFAKTVPGVTRVWVLPNQQGPGSVGIAFVEDGQRNIIPNQAKIREVQEAINARRPVTADPVVFAPTETPLNLRIRIRPNNPSVQAAVEAQLDDLIFEEAQVRQAVDPARVAEGFQYTGEIPLSKINEAISVADGEEDHVLENQDKNPRPAIGGILTKGTTVYSTLPG